MEPSTSDDIKSEGGTPVPMVTTHMARFEFSDQGTKILMIEWLPGGSESDPDPEPDSVAGGWEISWPGKSTFLPARDRDNADQDGDRRRVYFLLPKDATVPGTVTITRPGRPAIEVKPLPAIFPEGFDFEAGPRGVLHTIWAKKRLSELKREMDAEMRANAESVGLDMALAEKQWIVENFLPAPPPAAPPPSAISPIAPGFPRSPVAGRLSDKLKGLRLGTTASDLAPSPTANTFTEARDRNLSLSPQGGDVAVSSFSSMPRSTPAPAPAPTLAAPMSLNAALKGDVPVNPPGSQDTEDDLFALPMSPRSPDMKKSPFSVL